MSTTSTKSEKFPNSVQTGLEPWFLVPGGYGDIVTHEARCGFVGLKMSFSGGILDAGPGS